MLYLPTWMVDFFNGINYIVVKIIMLKYSMYWVFGIGSMDKWYINMYCIYYLLYINGGFQ